MKSKLCWIPFIPLTIAAVVCKLLDTFSIVDMGNTMSYLSVGAILLMFAVNIVFVAMDKETSPVYLLSRNVPAAVFSMLAAALIASKSSLNMILDLQAGALDFFKIMSCGFGILSAICLVVISLSHIQGRNFLPRMAVLFLTMPVWGGLMLITEFLNNRTVSVNTIDPIMLFAYAFAMIFLFKLSMVIATVDGKNPVKAMFLYGLPLAGIGITLGLHGIFSIAVDGLDYSENIVQFAFMSLALYSVFFCVEISKYSRKKKEQLIKYDLDEFEEVDSTYGEYGIHQDNYVVAPEEQTGDYDYDYSYAGEEVEDFVSDVDEEYTEDYDYIYGYGTETDVTDLVAPPEEETEEDDVILVDSEVVDSFQEEVVRSNEQARAIQDNEVEYDDEAMQKINRLIEDINK